jgi:hypothetical protein
VSKALRWIAPLVVVLLLAAPVLAQGQLIFRDDAGVLDRSRIERAAQPLLDRGALVAVYTTPNGNETDFQQRLEQDGLARGGGVNPNMIAIYVSFNPRYSAIRFGDRWNQALGTNNNYESIRTAELNPGLAAGDATSGFVNALAAIDRAIESPPRPGGGTTVNVNLIPLVLGGLFVVLLLFLGPGLWRAYSRRREAARAFANARRAAEEARQQAGAAIADMGQALQDARAKAEYDRLSYTADDVRQLAEWQASAEAQFVRAQEQFDRAGETLAATRAPTQADYEAAAAAYTQIAQEVAAARAVLEQAEARRAELDKINAAAPGEVDRAKKALADVAGRLGALGDDFARPDAILRPLQAQVARAESLLADRRAAEAITAAQAASAAIEELNQVLARYAEIREGISAARAAAEKVASQGYRIEAGLKALDTAEERLRQAATALAERGPAEARALLEQAEAARAEGVARGGGMPELRRANEDRLPRVQQAGEQLAAYIAEGRRAFDLVDEFAESTWSDIRGNGSEAEAAAARAHALWQRAAERNSMDVQDFLGAKQDLDAAEEQIAYARTLIDAILQRLKDLEAARDAARQEIAAAQADIDAGWAFVRSHDPDVGKVPEETLARAAAQLERANAELAKARPDWLAIVKYAQEANRLADEALAGARSEVEAMNKLRDQVARAQQLATAEVQKIMQFTALHSNDLPAWIEQKLHALQADVQAAYQALQAAEQRDEAARADALRDALAHYTKLQSTAEQLYGEIYAAFQRIEGMRRRVADEAERAERALARAEQRLHQARALVPPDQRAVDLIAQAHAALESIGVVHDENQMKRALAAAATARRAAEQAEEILREQLATARRPIQRDDGMGDFLSGVLIGTLLNSNRRGHGSGWGGSWGGSGGGWGGGGGGGGGWGGGGGGGGGWGGGGGGGSGW